MVNIIKYVTQISLDGKDKHDIPFKIHKLTSINGKILFVISNSYNNFDRILIKKQDYES